MLKTEGTSEKRPSVEVEPLETSNEVTQDTDRVNKKKNRQSTECQQGKQSFGYIRVQSDQTDISLWINTVNHVSDKY